MSNKPGKTTILDLPPELIDQIADNLFLEWKQLRLTCRYLYNTTTPAWAAFWFGKLDTDLSETSFTRLERIVNHGLLAQHVKKLSIGGHYNDHEIGKDVNWQRTPDGILVPAQPATARLRAIIAGLPNCRLFHIQVRGDGEPYRIPGPHTPNPLSVSEAAGILIGVLAGLKREITEFGIVGVDSAQGYPVCERRQPTSLDGLVAAALAVPRFQHLWSGLRSLIVTAQALKFFYDEDVSPAAELAVEIAKHARKLRRLEIGYRRD
ncbi:hypothetical protein BJY00DRAFT_311438 [Aspergillus carlsbadensis]|nr:hypothetical protein BJY00DRAFT_311438 [Aspergillus carlsbadensis]